MMNRLHENEEIDHGLPLTDESVEMIYVCKKVRKA